MVKVIVLVFCRAMKPQRMNAATLVFIGITGALNNYNVSLYNRQYQCCLYNRSTKPDN